jgi:tRNA (mo5U34)-methyltransferase
MLMNITREKLLEEIDKFRYWYHKIDLGNGVITPGLNFDSIWNLIRKVRRSIDYQDKVVLDIASFDGMWAFEAEKLGAKIVVATDCYYETYKNLLFCRAVLDSKVIPYYNVNAYNLCDRLDVYMNENWDDQKPHDRRFDIVQHLGLLYHLRDPLLSLLQVRSVMKEDGLLLIETAAVINEDASFMLFNGGPPLPRRIYGDLTTWWAPTIPCLKEMLRASMFEPIEGSIKTFVPGEKIGKSRGALKNYLNPRKSNFTIARVCLVAKVISRDQVDPEYFRELARTYRNPGLDIFLREM